MGVIFSYAMETIHWFFIVISNGQKKKIFSAQSLSFFNSHLSLAISIKTIWSKFSHSFKSAVPFHNCALFSLVIKMV